MLTSLNSNTTRKFMAHRRQAALDVTRIELKISVAKGEL